MTINLINFVVICSQIWVRLVVRISNLFGGGDKDLNDFVAKVQVKSTELKRLSSWLY